MTQHNHIRFYNVFLATRGEQTAAITQIAALTPFQFERRNVESYDICPPLRAW